VTAGLAIYDTVSTSIAVVWFKHKLYPFVDAGWAVTAVMITVILNVTPLLF
jgi:hypothetical protein